MFFLWFLVVSCGFLCGLKYLVKGDTWQTQKQSCTFFSSKWQYHHWVYSAVGFTTLAVERIDQH
jgi:hypothetical protein